MKIYGGVEAKLHSFQAWEMDAAEWSVSSLGRPNLPKTDFGIL